MLPFLLSCAPSEYRHTPVALEGPPGASTALETPERTLLTCGEVITTGLDPCRDGVEDTGGHYSAELLERISGDTLQARYPLDGDACLISAGCDDDWLGIWVVAGDAPCIAGEPLKLPAHLAADLDYAVCLSAVAIEPGMVASCWLETTGGAFTVVVENPVDNL